MSELINLQKLLCPDLLKTMQRRYKILHTIQLLEPIGRRGLSEQVALKERVVRSELDYLAQQGMIVVSAKGVLLTATGLEVITKLTPYLDDLSGFQAIEEKIKQTLKLDHVIITPGDSDQHDWVKQDLGLRAVEFLQLQLQSNQTIAVTGGTTMATAAAMMRPSIHSNGCVFVPARGGLGERVENQANTICAEMAKKMKGDYRMLYVPDPLSEETYHSIIQEPAVKDILHMINQASIVMHGIGDAFTMARRRKATAHVLDKLKSGKAVSEAFGYYFNRSGEVVYKVRTVGMQLEELSNIRTVIAIAGGKSKAEAIDSYLRQGKSNVLITDEAAAKALIKGFSL
ncbi:central glycolytic genes regulator [Amphibacillus marinus]|uniref:Central glycolytic genes regulator n=1 Tax=Amphibacillus marinus TaxID=872970 RepID=A0A1H8Q3D2_9BACI|nr:sugar-binding domain-containing protein [Amphibacillus marinus]SEO48765.1 central glycolytic genes regulator [Amphibacillus marinus]